MKMCYQNFRDCIFSSALYGMFAWTVYAVIEGLFSSILPWIIQPHFTYKPLHWGFTVLLFGIYPIFGLILGGLCGLNLRAAAVHIQFLQKAQSEILFPAVTTFTLVLAFIINLVIELPPKSPFVLLALFVSFPLAVALTLSAFSDIWARRLFFATNPWTTCLLSVGVQWIITEVVYIYSREIKVASAVVYFFTMLLVSYFVERMLRARRANNSKLSLLASPMKNFVYLFSGVLVVLGMSFFLAQETYVEESYSKSIPLNSRHPHVLLITMDSVRGDHLSLYGYEKDTTPNLRTFPEEATLYTRAIASGDMTLSSIASMFTGLYARQHGAHYHPPKSPAGRPLAEKFHTLAEILSSNGYLTMGVVANYGFLGHGFRLDQGFQYYDQRVPVPFLSATSHYYLRQSIRNFFTLFSSSSEFDLITRRAEEINKEVFKLLEQVQKDESPCFLFVNYMDAHWPYIPPPPFDTRYPDKIEKFTLARYFDIVEEVLKLKHKIKQQEHNHLLSQYDGAIAYLDFHIGKLIERMKELGLYENCLIIITSDHGEVFGERDLIEHGVSVYQDQIHIPLIIKYPNTNKKKVVNEVVSAVDLMPTILDVLGYEIPENVQGKSLLKLESGKSRTIISESFQRETLLRWHKRFHRIERAIFFGTYKFISSTAGKRELYDLSNDPNEKMNLYKTDDNKSIELEARLNEWLKTTPAESDSAAKLDKQTLDRLKSLGYIK